MLGVRFSHVWRVDKYIGAYTARVSFETGIAGDPLSRDLIFALSGYSCLHGVQQKGLIGGSVPSTSMALTKCLVGPLRGTCPQHLVRPPLGSEEWSGNST